MRAGKGWIVLAPIRRPFLELMQFRQLAITLNASVGLTSQASSGALTAMWRFHRHMRRFAGSRLAHLVARQADVHLLDETSVSVASLRAFREAPRRTLAHRYASHHSPLAVSDGHDKLTVVALGRMSLRVLSGAATPPAARDAASNVRPLLMGVGSDGAV